MKLSFALSAACAAVASAAEYSGTIYTYNRSPGKAPSAPSISTSDARLLLAHRLGLAAYHNIGDADDATLELIARSSSFSQKPLFSAQAKDGGRGRKSLFLISGVSDEQLLAGHDHQQYEAVARLSDKPSSEADVNFMQELISLGRRARNGAKTCDFGLDVSSGSSWISGHTIASYQSGVCHEAGFQTKHAPTSSQDLIPGILSSISSASDADMLDLYYINLSSAPNPTEATTLTRDLLRSVIQSPPSSHQITVVTLPRHSPSTSNSHAWSVKHSAKRSLLSNDEEEILAASPSNVPSSPKKPALSPLAKGNRTVRTTQARCASSMDACIAKTNNCSGHGECRLWGREKDLGPTCYSCACSVTSEKGRTQAWGGPACQKRDVSTPFWLFAGFGVAMASMLTWGVGLLYSMGETKLPSVLSAGVPPMGKK